MNSMETPREPGRRDWIRDAVLLAAFAGVIVWSLLFTVVRPAPVAAPAAGAAGAGGADETAAATGEYRGELTIRSTRLPVSAWYVVRVGDKMGKVATVTKVKKGTELHVTLKVTGPIPFATERYPFPQQNLPLRIGSLVWFETSRYNLVGDVIAMNP